jgi:hypothetical protein
MTRLDPTVTTPHPVRKTDMPRFTIGPHPVDETRRMDHRRASPLALIAAAAGCGFDPEQTRRPGHNGHAGSVEHTTLGGEPAVAWTAACSDGYNVNKIAAVHATRGYMILLPSPTANGRAKDRRVFESIRRSFRFTRQSPGGVEVRG